LISVSEKQLKEVEYLISQSIQGNHLLFQPEEIRQAFDGVCELQDGNGKNNVDSHIELLISQPNIIRKRAYIEGLDTGTLRRVIKTYFSIVETNMTEGSKYKH